MDNHLVIAELSKCRDVDTMILKGHLLVEQHLVQFIMSKAAEQINYTKINFAMKVKICQILSLFVNDQDLLKSIMLLNKMRNELSHDLEPKRKHIEEYLQGLDEDIRVNEALNIFFAKEDRILVTTLQEEKYWSTKQNFYTLNKIVSTCNRIKVYYAAN